MRDLSTLINRLVSVPYLIFPSCLINLESPQKPGKMRDLRYDHPLLKKSSADLFCDPTGSYWKFNLC